MWCVWHVSLVLLQIRYDIHKMGNSNAQRDVIHQTLILALINARRAAEAAALISERRATYGHKSHPWTELMQQKVEVLQHDQHAPIRMGDHL